MESSPELEVVLGFVLLVFSDLMVEEDVRGIFVVLPLVRCQNMDNKGGSRYLTYSKTSVSSGMTLTVESSNRIHWFLAMSSLAMQ